MAAETKERFIDSEWTKDEKEFAHEWRKKEPLDLLEEICKITSDQKIKLLAKTFRLRLNQRCQEVAGYVGEVPRSLGVNNLVLRDVFDQVAECIRDIQDHPHTARSTASNLKYDGQRIPELNEEVRREGYEQGYNDAQKNTKNFDTGFEIDID